MTDIIKQLKENTSAFGLMSEEMQTKARGIGKYEFEYFDGTEWGAKGLCEAFACAGTYRLRSGYEESPEIVECEIFTSHQQLMYAGRSGPTGIHKACKDPDFIGFKFEDGYISAHPIMYRAPNDIERHLKVVRGDCAALHATHVLFRGSK